MQDRIDSDFEALVEKLPSQIQGPLRMREDLHELLEVVLDLGRVPEARFLSSSELLDSPEVSQDDIQYVIERIGLFGDDNRAGIERTLHRISAIRNRGQKIVGLTLRVGRAVYGTIRVIEDLILTGKSVLLLGKPGVGKTTMLREVARVLADDARKRVIVVDTSNEIAGDGDIPHPGIGRARRMQVRSPAQQHTVMIEAVENHMPEVIIIDEIGTELDANAARTIAERGVQLVATAHGNTLDNLIQNPTLSDLVGGVHTVTLGDVEARRRQTQKTVLERRAPPTFDVLVEIQSWQQMAVHGDVAEVVDRMLRGYPVTPQIRTIDKDSIVHTTTPVVQSMAPAPFEMDDGDGEGVPFGTDQEPPPPQHKTHILPYGVNKGKLQQAVRGINAPVELVNDLEHADLLLTTKNYHRRKTQAIREAELKGKPVYVLRRNTTSQIEQFLRAISRKQLGFHTQEAETLALKEAEEALIRLDEGEPHIALNPQGSYVRRLQHQIAETHGISSASTGREPRRHVVFRRR